MLTIGIDVGWRTTKAVLFRFNDILAFNLIPTHNHEKSAGRHAFSGLLMATGLSAGEVDGVVATGWGGKQVDFADKSFTEITCITAGARYLNPTVRTIMDMGGRSSKIISLNDKGKVQDYLLSDRYTAGPGRFLEVMSKALEVDPEELGSLSLKAGVPSQMDCNCAVFAESEVLALLSKGQSKENIIAGLHFAIAAGLAAMAGILEINGPVMATGGVSKNIGIVKALEKKLQVPITVNRQAQMTGAIGAALIASALA